MVLLILYEDVQVNSKFNLHFMMCAGCLCMYIDFHRCYFCLFYYYIIPFVRCGFIVKQMGNYKEFSKEKKEAHEFL